MKSVVDQRRVRRLDRTGFRGGYVIYWMSRDQRVSDNWALLYARELADRFDTRLIVVFCLAPSFLGAEKRQYEFMIEGLREVEFGLRKVGISLVVLGGDPPDQLSKYIVESGAGAVVTDFSPLRIKRDWTDKLLKKVNMPIYEVDAHNIVPCWIASQKREYGAYTIRPRINSKLDEFLTDFPSLKKQKSDPGEHINGVDWERLSKTLNLKKGASGYQQPKSGSKSARKVMTDFIKHGVDEYSTGRNDPNLKSQSGFSPYLHFGQISAQRIALETSKVRGNRESVKSFLEELVVRRELSDNFCYYSDNYDTTECFPDWALKTLDKHRKDKREFVYSIDEFEGAETHDNLWNAAQTEMVLAGRMNGYLRMYWAKKILEWSPSPEDAMKTAIHLNDKYQFDGRDPNGYAGIAWSIGGVHDRPWRERPVFGKIRYMNEAGCRRKFDVDGYIRNISEMRSRY